MDNEKKMSDEELVKAARGANIGRYTQVGDIVECMCVKCGFVQRTFRVKSVYLSPDVHRSQINMVCQTCGKTQMYSF
jgi:hypothetical protein